MSEQLRAGPSTCKNCYKCIRVCPVKSIRFHGDRATIIGSECVLCGQCFVVCPQHKTLKSRVYAIKAMIDGGEKVIASIDPAFIAAFEDVTIASMRTALKKLGFADVEETAVGVAIAVKEYERMIEDGAQDVIISSSCNTVNMLVQKHYPEALRYLAHTLSPMQAHGMDIKRRCHGVKTVYIGPCMSRRSEARYLGYIDCVISFEELEDWLNEAGIALAYAPDNSMEGRSRLFPIAGGIIKSMSSRHEDYDYIAVDGIENCKRALKEIIAGGIHKCFVEMSACEGGCIGGPAMGKNRRSPIGGRLAVRGYATDKPFSIWNYSTEELYRDMPSQAIHRSFIGAEAINEVLRKMGKTKPEHELNCGSCGYNTCREKAVAVLLGKADLNMCLPFLKEKAESFSHAVISNTPNAIIALNDVCEIQQINASACKLLSIADPQEVQGKRIDCILDVRPFVQVCKTGNNIYHKRAYLERYEKYVRQSIIYDRSSHAIICVMRDVTDDVQAEKTKEQRLRTTIEITDKVIEKQMMTVQEIASLLGETTAETKVALTKLKEFLAND